MAASTQINVDVDSAEFQAFADKFAQYAALLATVPDIWKKAGQASTVVKTKFEDTAASAGLVASNMVAIHNASKEFSQITISTTRHWKELALSTAGVAKNIVAATESLLKWTGILGLVTGAGGLFGFDRLAHSVASQRTGALGVGSDYASRGAFATAFRRFGDPEGFLGRVSEDISSMGPQLRRLGLSQAELKGDTTDVAIRALRRGAQIAAKTRTDLLDVVPQLQIFSHEERMRLKTHPEEIEEMAGKVPQYRKELALSPADQRAYSDFVTQMERASRSIETIFVKGLVRLADPLKNLSSEVVKLVDRLMAKDGPLDTLIADLSKVIEWLAGEIDKPEFQKTVNDFIAGVGHLAESLGHLVTGILKFANWLGIGPGGSSAPLASFIGQSGGETSLDATRPGGGTTGGGKRGEFGYRGGGGTAAPISGAQKTANAQESWNYWKSKGYSDNAAAALIAMERGESGFTPNAVDPTGFTKGSFQWDPNRRAAIQRATGIDVSRASHTDELRAAEWEMQHGDAGAQRFRRNLTQPGSVESYVHSGIHDFERSGNQPKDYGIRLPYARSALQQFKHDDKQVSSKKPQINIRNNPGGNTVDAANAAAAGSP